MSNIKLNKSRVVFTDNPHMYTLDGKELSGVTSMLHRQLFPKKYEGIPKSVLDAAAERGSSIHNDCELADSLGVTPSSYEGQEYLRLRTEMGFIPVDNEYTVSNETSHASNIDLVWTREGDTEYVDLADIKCTSKLDEDYLAYQLSVYKYFFEMQNPHLKVRSLWSVWLPKPAYGKCAINEVREIPRAEIERLIEVDAQGGKFIPMENGKVTLPLALKNELQAKFSANWAAILEAERLRKEIEESVRKAMEEFGLEGEKVMFGDIEVSLGKPSSSEKFDSKTFKAENPELYKKYTYITNTKGRLTIKQKK